MPSNKTDNFLKAIKGYAKHQKNVMQGEVKQLKTERLREAEEKAKRDSELLLKEKLNETHNRLTAQLASQTQEGQRKLFIERTAMAEEIFRSAADKLTQFTKSKAYRAKLKDGAAAIAALFDGKPCVLYLSERDMGAAKELQSLFGGSAEVQADKTIKIGGIRGYCESMGIIADETLDSKLEAQRGWFVENAALSVL